MIPRGVRQRAVLLTRILPVDADLPPLRRAVSAQRHLPLPAARRRRLARGEGRREGEETKARDPEGSRPSVPALTQRGSRPGYSPPAGQGRRSGLIPTDRAWGARSGASTATTRPPLTSPRDPALEVCSRGLPPPRTQDRSRLKSTYTRRIHFLPRQSSDTRPAERAGGKPAEEGGELCALLRLLSTNPRGGRGLLCTCPRP